MEVCSALHATMLRKAYWPKVKYDKLKDKYDRSLFQLQFFILTVRYVKQLRTWHLLVSKMTGPDKVNKSK